jgi:hypothetical protein
MTPSTRSALALVLAAAATLAGCKKQEAPPAPPPVETARSLAAIVASCASAVGTVEVRRAGQATWEAVAPGSVFRVGDEVRTAPLSTARIEFLAGGGLELEEKADVFIDTAPPERPASPGEAAPAAETRVAVKEGVVRGFLPEAASSTATSAVGLVIAVGDGKDVRLSAQTGGKATFRLSRKEQGTEVAVTAGKATLSGVAGARALAAGQLAVASAAGVTEAVELIDFPQSVEPGIDARMHLVPDLVVRLAWKPVPGASAYRVQIARDLSFQRVDRSAIVDGTQLAFSPKEPGMYAWRVASVDGEKRQGEFGFARRVYCEEQPPLDLLVGPADGAVVRYTDALPTVTFTWASSGDVQKYRVVLASGPDLLEERVVSMIVEGQRAQLKLLEAGEYWWGVYQGGIHQDSEKPPQPIFSKPRRIYVVKVAKPRMDVPRSITRWGE